MFIKCLVFANNSTANVLLVLLFISISLRDYAKL